MTHLKRKPPTRGQKIPTQAQNQHLVASKSANGDKDDDFPPEVIEEDETVTNRDVIDVSRNGTLGRPPPTRPPPPLPNNHNTGQSGQPPPIQAYSDRGSARRITIGEHKNIFLDSFSS